jgi:hypothetical protein
MSSQKIKIISKEIKNNQLVVNFNVGDRQLKLQQQPAFNYTDEQLIIKIEKELQREASND